MTGQESKHADPSRPEPQRSRWRPYPSTYVVLVVLSLLLTLANVPGQVVVAPDPLQSDPSPPRLGSCRTCEHGWPLTHMWRESVVVGTTTRLSVWSLSEGIQRISYFHLALNLIAGAVVLLLGAVFYEAWRRRRSKIYQFHVSDMLILIAVVSVVLAWLSSAAKQYRDEQEIVKQLDVISSGCEWQPGGSSWLREWIGDDYFRIFDRVVQVELGHKQHFARWLRDAETTGVLSANNVPDYAAVPRIEGTRSVMTDRDNALPGLSFPDHGPDYPAVPRIEGTGSVMTGQDHALSGFSLPDGRDEAQRQRSDSEILAALDADLVSLGRLTNLRGLILDKTGITDKEMARLAGLTKLQSLELRERRIGDGGLAYLADLTNLERLSLSGTGVTDDGLVHLKKLNKLKNLSLDTPWITDAGLAHIKHLTKLELLQIDSQIASGAALQHIGALTKLRCLTFHAAKVTDAHVAHIAHLTELEQLWLNFTGVTDAGLVHLSGMINLRNLNLGRAHITDAGLSHLKGLANLESLNLNGAHITDTGLVHLEALSKLESLNLGGAQVTDAGLVHLERLANLRFVFLRNTRVTKEGVARLRSALGNRTIVDGP